MCADSIQETKNELFLEVLQRSGIAHTKVGGNSMLPTLRVGDLLTVEAARAADVRSGDIVVCFQAGTFCTHRVIGRHGDFLITRGDANLRVDAPVSAEDCVGRVVYAQRDGEPVPLEYRPISAFLLRRSSLLRKMYYWCCVRERS